MPQGKVAAFPTLSKRRRADELDADQLRVRPAELTRHGRELLGPFSAQELDDRALDEVDADEGLIFPRFEYRRILFHAARRAVARRAGILDTKVDTDAGQAAEKRPVARLKSSESFGGPSRTRTWSQWIKNAPQVPENIEFFNDSASHIASRNATKRFETTLFGHGVQRESGVAPMENVHAAAATLLHRVAEGGEISISVLREFAELVLRSELVEASRQVLEGPPEFAVRRALELASLVLGSRARG